MSRAITLLTDFGTRDTFVGQMKGVIHSIAPSARVIDLSHAVNAQDIVQAAVMLGDAVDAFDSQTIHVAVVDPGVGGTRRAIAVHSDAGTFVGPDNGLFTRVLEDCKVWRIVELSDPAYHRPQVSATFHGRDVFAPVAGHLAAGVAVEQVGPAVADYQRIALPVAEVDANGITAHVLYVDAFGNLVTDLERGACEPLADAGAAPAARIAVAGKVVRGLSRTYSDVGAGQAVAYWGSGGRLELAVRGGSAAKAWGVDAGAVVRVRL